MEDVAARHSNRTGPGAMGRYRSFRSTRAMERAGRRRCRFGLGETVLAPGATGGPIW
jgi:hypothetical protein